LEWFVDEIRGYRLDKQGLENEVLARKNVLIEAYYVANEIEGEVNVKIKRLGKPREAYIDAQILSNSILIRLVRTLKENYYESIREILYLGEIEVPGKVVYSHEHSRVSGKARVEWFTNVIKKLGVSEEEIELYSKGVRNNVERIVKAKEHAKEINGEVSIIIEGESEEVFETSIMRMVGILATPLGNLFIYFAEEHISNGYILHYFYKMGRIIACGIT